MNINNISENTIRRLPVYLHYLYAVKGSRNNISSSAIATEFGLNDVQVRKDLAMVSGSGRPKTGYIIEELIEQIENCLGRNSRTKAILVGVGNLGKALLAYSGFTDYGIEIAAAFDIDKVYSNTQIAGKNIYVTNEMEQYCKENNIELGVICVPIEAAQDVCDRLIEYGIKAIWNFAPTILKAPENVLVENENLASSLAILSRHIRKGSGN